MIARRDCIVCHGSGTMPDLEDSSRSVECEFCEPEPGENMEQPTVERTTRQLKEIQLALVYKQVLGGYGTDGHHRLMLIASDAEEQGYSLRRGGNELFSPPHVVEVLEPKRG